MDIIQALVLGIIQGLTEWLPLSSSGHLALGQKAMGIDSEPFIILLHGATLIVVIVYFRKDIWIILREWFKGISAATKGTPAKDALWGTKERRLGGLIVIASVPTGILGYLIDAYLESYALSSLLILGIFFIATGVFLAIARLRRPKARKVMGASGAAVVGVAQGVAALPGLSRSGWTISTALLLGIAPEDAAKFSFILSIPAVIGANLLKFNEIRAMASLELPVIVVGFVAALIVGFLALILAMKIVKAGKLYWFAPYCMGLGAVVIYLYYL